MSEFQERPDWWPPNPYPKSVFTMTTNKYVEAVPDETLRTAISGYMSRCGWEVADHDIYAQVEEQVIIPLEEAQVRIKALEGVVEAAKKLVDLVVEHFDGCTYTKSMSTTSCSCGISGLLDALSKLEEV